MMNDFYHFLKQMSQDEVESIKSKVLLGEGIKDYADYRYTTGYLAGARRAFDVLLEAIKSYEKE